VKNTRVRALFETKKIEKVNFVGPNNRDGALFVTKNSSWHTFGDKQIELAHLLGPKIEWAHFLGQKNRDGAFFGKNFFGKKSSWHTF